MIKGDAVSARALSGLKSHRVQIYRLMLLLPIEVWLFYRELGKHILRCFAMGAPLNRG
jgi:hypothetical protein